MHTRRYSLELWLVGLVLGLSGSSHTMAEQRLPSTAPDATSSAVNLSLGQLSASTASADRDHADWVVDLESKAWPGFITGLKGYDDFVMPIGTPVYFEDPFVRTDLRLFYAYHKIPGGSVLRGGQINVVGAQIRVALTERLQFLATKDGYSWVDTGITSAGDGWNDVAVGLKYVVESKPEQHLLTSVGFRWEWANGSTDAFQGRTQELNPFVSFARAWDKWHFLGAINGRIPTNRDEANASVVWNLHFDYEYTKTFRPLIEIVGIHWLSNAKRLPLNVDYLDVGSLGSSDVRGRDFFAAGIGFRWQAREDVSVGLLWEFPLESPSAGIMEQRITFNTTISF